YLFSVVFLFLFLLLIRPPPISTLFPYTTLFRSYYMRVFASPAQPGASGNLTKISCGSFERCELQFSMHRLQAAQFRRNRRIRTRSEEHTSELQSLAYLVCRLLLEKKNNIKISLK